MIGFNGTGLSLQPSTARWLAQEMLGVNGSAHGIYPALREFEMVFNLSSQQDVYELIAYFNQIGVTGTLVAELPAYGTNTFQYRNYSGVVLRQPETSDYFNEEWLTEVRVLLLVRT